MTSTGLLILASGFVLMVLAGVPEVNRRIPGMFPGWFMAGLGALIMALGGVPLWNGVPIWNPVLRPTFPIWLNIPLGKSSAFFKPLSICETLAVGMAIITP